MITSLVCLAAFAIALPILWAAREVTRRAGLVDRPDERKHHRGNVPLAGGIGVYATLVVTAVGIDLLFGPALSIGRFGEIALLLGALALLLGIVDDARNLDPRLRLLGQGVIALVLALFFDVRVESLGNLLGTGAIAFGTIVSVVFTVFCLVGALNATNMTDGLDGLLASLIALSLAALTLLALIAPVAPELLCIIAIGALGAFLVLNLGIIGERRRVFLGDSGSTLLGLLIAVLLIGYAQEPGAAIEPVVAGWLFGLPLLDTTVVVVRRVLEGRSPLRAGRDHLHHLLQGAGLSAPRTLLIMIGLHGAMLGVGVTAQLSSLPAWAFLYGFVALTLAHFVATGRIATRVRERVGEAAELPADRVVTEMPGARASAQATRAPGRPAAGAGEDGRRAGSREVADVLPD